MKTDPNDTAPGGTLRTITTVVYSWISAIFGILVLDLSDLQFGVALVAVTLAAVLRLVVELTRADRPVPVEVRDRGPSEPGQNPGRVPGPRFATG